LKTDNTMKVYIWCVELPKYCVGKSFLCAAYWEKLNLFRLK